MNEELQELRKQLAYFSVGLTALAGFFLLALADIWYAYPLLAVVAASQWRLMLGRWTP